MVKIGNPLEVCKKYAKMFDDNAFGQKILKTVGKIGREMARQLLILYYTLQRPDVPRKAKAIIMGALAYFVCPVDMLPDFIPVVGYSDDLLIVAACVAYVRSHTTQAEIDKAEEKLEMILGYSSLKNYLENCSALRNERPRNRCRKNLLFPRNASAYGWKPVWSPTKNALVEHLP